MYLSGALIFGPYTGACINPMRIMGYNLFRGNFDGFAIYCFASLAGNLFGGFYYYQFMMKVDEDYVQRN